MSPRVSEEYKKQKKASLLEAAKQVFIRKGYHQATMQDIMDEAGVSRGALYAYFEDIEHVYLELLELEDQKEISFFSEDEQTASWRRLEEWIGKQQQMIERADQTLVLANLEFFMSARFRKQKDHYPYITSRYERITEAFTGFVRQGTESGMFNPQVSPESIARCLVSFMDGLMLGTFHIGSEWTKVGEQLALFQSALKNMLQPVEEES